MKKLLLIKYSPEIFLKGLNRNKFEKTLKDNIRRVLKGVDHRFVIDSGRWFLYSEDIDELAKRVTKVFGVQEVCMVKEVNLSFEDICHQALKEIEEGDYKTFKVETNRANKKFPKNSMEISREVGAFILKHRGDLKVDVKNPDVFINVEVREKGAYIYSKKIKGVGGMPYGTNGSTLLMLSGGIDSPVAGYMMGKRGVELHCVYFHSHPYTSERAKEKVITLNEILKSYTGNTKLYIVPFTKIQMEIMDKCREDELTIIMRRFMMRIACGLASIHNISSVTTGESIGQVASQTMESLVVTNAVGDRPVFRPLISMDKEEIMNISRQIGAYETSILPYEDCCTIFVPKHPKTKPVLSVIEKSESVLDIEDLVKDAIENTEVIQ
ncbi:tRNA 4-thiouridine(8) synthase ThiI [Clostridium sp. MSJ-11]|uniref:Probable tRNA sulfurtransferase n=1 Tax=Clostridium mobile TaxID=2841512 RepID=A0ABS6EK21_9CLOT|nr:tRNA uracil 4-sulfurtransferase ThiI [Clostridium mobile]MBU5484795.1 tRNA 4-thiouridine(8) synthase ThiI [Clostridium mobile]